jgi:hypothetical protein
LIEFRIWKYIYVLNFSVHFTRHLNDEKVVSFRRKLREVKSTVSALVV